MKIQSTEAAGFVSELERQTEGLEESIQRYFDLLQREVNGVFALLLFSLAVALVLPIFDYICRPVLVGFFLFFSESACEELPVEVRLLILIALIFLDAASISAVTFRLKRIRSRVQAFSLICRRGVARATEMLEHSRLSEKEKKDLSRTVQHAESVIKEAQRTLYIGPLFARKYT